MLRAVLLAAAGQHARARMALDGFRDEGLEETQRRAYRRFVRQLGRWLDTGGPPVPPLEQTLSQPPMALSEPIPEEFPGSQRPASYCQASASSSEPSPWVSTTTSAARWSTARRITRAKRES